MHFILTVGSTSFSPLVASFLSPASLAALASLNPTSVTLQTGTSDLPSPLPPFPVALELHRFLPDLEQRVAQADLVISAGSILSFIRSTKTQSRTLILVPNSTLMDSHQADLADELEAKGWAIVCKSPGDLAETLNRLASGELAAPSAATYPPLDPTKVSSILDETLGF
ncbi:hypothetical protein RQP46_011318 [Phenoliferia psychrophenolica]